MSVIPTVYNQGTGLIGSTTAGTTVPENVDNLIVNQNLLVGGTGTFNGPVTVNNTLTVSGTISFADVNITGIFTVVNMSASGFVLVAGEVRGDTLVSDTSITAGTTITAGDSVTGSAFRATLFSSNSVCFFSSTGQIDFNNNFTYNTGTNTLSVLNLSATDITATDITATDITVADILATGNISATNFTASGNITASSGIITGNSYVCNTNIQLNEVNPGGPGTQNRIIFNDIGTIEARRDSGGKRQFDLVNRNAAGITFQIRLQEDVNYYNVPAGGCHCFYIDTVRVAELERANPTTTFTLEEGIMSYNTSSNDYIIRNGYASQLGFAVNMQSDGTLQLLGDGQGGATGGVGVRVFTRESAGNFERLRITNLIVDAKVPLVTSQGIGSTYAARIQLPASAPGGNNWLLRVLDSTATPPTTEWYNPGSGASFAYVDYDTSSNRLQHVVPGASAVYIHRIRVNEFIYAQLYVVTGNLYLTNAVQNGILYCTNQTNGLMTTKNTFRFDDTVETLYLTNLSGSRISVVDINALGIIDSTEFRCKNLGAIFYKYSPGTTTPLSFDFKADVASGSQIQLLTSGGIHFETQTASQIFLFSHRVGSTVTDSLEISSSLIDAKVPLQTVGIDVTGTLKIYDTANSGTNNAQLIIDGTYGLRFDHPDGYLFRRGNNWKLLIGSTTTTSYNNFHISSVGQQGHLTVDGDVTLNTAQISSAPRNMNVLFHDNGTGDKRIKEKDTFHFNPSSNILTTPNLTVDGQISVGTSLLATSENRNLNIMFHDNDVADKRIKEKNNFHFNPSSNILTTPNLTVDGDVTLNTAQISSANRNMNVLFHDNGTGDKRIKEKDTFHFNPSSNILTTPNLTVEGTSTFKNTITVANGATVTLTDNASSISLLTGSIFNHATNVYMGFRGQYTTGVDYNIAIWDDGHVRYKARGPTGHRFDVIDPATSTTDQVLQLNFTTVDVYKNLNIRGDAQIQADNDFTFLEASQTAAGDKGVIFWPNIGRLIGRRTGTLEAEIQLVNAVARNTVDFQFSCQENKTLINTPNVGGTGAVDIRVGSVQTLLVETLATTVKNFLKLEQAAVAAVDEELPLLCKREADDIVFKTEPLTTTYNPTSDTLSANNFNATAATIAADGLTYNAQVPTSGGARELLLLNSNGIIKKADSSLSYDPITKELTVDTVDVVYVYSTNALKYGGPLFNTPCNATFIIGNTGLVDTVDPLDSGSHGSWGIAGQGGGLVRNIYLGISRLLVKTRAFGVNADLWTWNAYQQGINPIITRWTCQSVIAGLWHIRISVQFQNNGPNTNDRWNPILRMEKNNVELGEGSVSTYSRYGQGKICTVVLDIKEFFSFTDYFELPTFISVGSSTAFTDNVPASEITLSNFLMQATFLGPLTEYDRTP
jgi:hypothetical protein